MSRVVAKYMYDTDQHAYIGVVSEDDIVVTVGMMRTEPEIKAWLDDTVERRAWEDESELPDMFNTQQ